LIEATGSQRPLKPWLPDIEINSRNKFTLLSSKGREYDGL